MATDDVNIAEDAEMAECDGDKVVTMMDVLQEQQDFEEDANAVLGASDDKNCTYPKGYIKRQALYACLTCCTEAKTDPTKRAGVCLACSLTCHENHELVELYTKRNFRCDCGNPKFNSNPCQFTSDKTDLNEGNVYNQNFSGLYCTCHRPYPDPESTIEDDMIQCIICEDWLHASHLDAVVPANDQYSEMICKSCMEKNEFLHDYSMFAVTVETGDVDIVSVNGDSKSTDNSLCNGDLEKEKLTNGIEVNKTESEPANVTVNGDVEMSEDKVKDDAEQNTTEEQNSSAENTEEKQTDISNVESESKSEDKEKANNDDSLADTETKATEPGDQPMETTEIKEDEKTTEESNTGKDNETEKDTSNDQSDATVITSEQKSDQSTDENAESTNDNMDSTDIKTDDSKDNDSTQNTDKEPQNTDAAISDQSEKEHEGDGDKVQESLVETSEDKSEQQLLNDLSELTADNSVAEEKPEEKMDQSGGGENIPANTTESGQEITKESESSDQKPVNESTADATNIEVPDTSQPAENEKENPEDKTDSVMDAIDELLDTANNAKDNATEEQQEETKNESSENKVESTEKTEIESSESKVESTEQKESDDVDMKPSETQPDKKVPEKTDETAETDEKMCTIKDTDVEMNDNAAQNQPASEDKQNDEPGSESGKDDKTEDIDKPDATVTEDKLDSESVTDKDEKSQLTDTANETINQDNKALNETDSELKTAGENGSTTEDDECKDKDKNEGSNSTENAKEHKRKLSSDDITDDSSSKKAKLECVRPKGVKRVLKGATFWPSNFRQKLCTCGECTTMYNDLKVLYLTDLEDTVFAYESLGKENVAGGASQYEKGLQALSSLDRIQQINALTEYNRMRDKLLDFLKSFKDRKEIVKEEDIKAFFAGMKPRREPDGVYFCR
ncbi:myb-like protein X [Helicoverpa armigera]|uniref:myb-like protein X n=1 Tax=Helicoverpa armigera TaxID=29058 RepID=UPI003082F771